MPFINQVVTLDCASCIDLIIIVKAMNVKQAC